MVLTRALKLMEIYSECPRCGNNMLGQEQGNLILDENLFERTCKCGFVVRVEEKHVAAEEAVPFGFVKMEAGPGEIKEGHLVAIEDGKAVKAEVKGQ